MTAVAPIVVVSLYIIGQCIGSIFKWVTRALPLPLSRSRKSGRLPVYRGGRSGSRLGNDCGAHPIDFVNEEEINPRNTHPPDNETILSRVIEKPDSVPMPPNWNGMAVTGIAGDGASTNGRGAIDSPKLLDLVISVVFSMKHDSMRSLFDRQTFINVIAYCCSVVTCDRVGLAADLLFLDAETCRLYRTVVSVIIF